MVEYTWGFIDLPEREGKPRKTGMSMVHDPGYSVSQFETFIEPVEPFLDYMKFRSLNPRLYPETQYFEKIEICKRNNIKVILGGNVGEMAWYQGKWETLCDYCKKHGWDTFEVSATYAPLTMEEKDRMIKHCLGMGFEVIYEWGLKHPEQPLDPNVAADEINHFLDLGVRLVILEEGEIDLLIGKDGSGAYADRLADLFDKVGLGNVMVEATEMGQLAWLLKTFGPDVCIGNLSFEQLTNIEPLRNGIGRLVDFKAYDKYR